MNDGETDLVLRIRLEGLRTNLEQLEDAGRLVAGRRKEIRDLEDVFDDQDAIQSAGRRLKKDLTMCLELTGEIEATDDSLVWMAEELGRRLEMAIQGADKVAEHALDSVRSTITAMSRHWKALPSADSFDRRVGQIFAKQAADLIKLIAQASGSDPDSGWELYRAKIRDQSDALFAEYVEFLGGLALRDTGLGGLAPSTTRTPEETEYNGDVCQMADDLIRQIYYIGGNELWHSMAVPARRDTAASTIARMIRLGFPDWTLWAVPLAAFEFGQVVADVNRLVELCPDDVRQGLSSADLRVVFADTFATYVMGPSYALATILTRLEPLPLSDAHVGTGPLSDAERLAVIFWVLDRMDDEGEYEDALNTLRELWSKSLTHNGFSRSAPEPEAPGQIPEPEEPADAMSRVRAWAERAFHFLADSASSVVYEPARWRQAMTWQPIIEQAANIDFQLRPQQDVRDILNAAWYRRIQPDAPTSRELAITAITLWQSDMKARLAGTGRPVKRKV